VGKDGYVVLTEKDINRLSKALNLSKGQFLKEYTDTFVPAVKKHGAAYQSFCREVQAYLALLQQIQDWLMDDLDEHFASYSKEQKQALLNHVSMMLQKYTPKRPSPQSSEAPPPYSSAAAASASAGSTTSLAAWVKGEH